MAAIVWLASYPKSGNTWVRILLANYLSASDEPVDINTLLLSSKMAGARALFDVWCGVEASALDTSVVDRLRADVYRCVAADSPEDVFIKVHDAWREDDQGRPMFPAGVTRATIYVVRNPLDVAVSAASHWHLDPETTVARMCESFIAARTGERLADQLQQEFGSWSDHVRSWLDRSGLSAHVVRYEDLRADPERSLAGVLEVCGLAPDPQRVRQAVEFSDFTELRRQEDAHGFRERARGSRDRFFRRGEVGAWRDELPAPLARRLALAHGETMTRLGYIEEELR